MRFKRRRSSARRGSPPGRKVWGGWTTFLDPGISVGAPQLGFNEYNADWLLSPNDAEDFYDEPTVIRLISRFLCSVDISTGDIANEYAALVQWGIIVTNPDGNGDVPFINLNDVTKQWLYHDEILLWHYAGHISQGFSLSATGGPQQGRVDIRSKRKIPEGSGLAAIVYNSTMQSALDFIGIEYFWNGRYLMIDH